ncbi:VOC family protein [Microcystis sp. 0824]|uniref:VOC family protein n=1 Tax=Microcystis sp. 0824 TaxID=1502726 RepID=UPI000D592D75|nr:VOC family protein [Microcystis sp. 0824]
MNIMRSLHTAILVTELEKAVNFYENVLGLTRIDRPFQYDGVWYQVGDYQIHLIVDSNYQNYRPNPEKWGRNPHLAFAIDDVAAMGNYLENQGYTIQMSASGRKALFVSDPDGNILEMSQI